MTPVSTFISRTGNIDSGSGDIFDFMTDIRNFRQFIPSGYIDNLRVEKESCDFNVSHVGKVSISLQEKEPHSRISYAGTALGTNNFLVTMHIEKVAEEKSHVQVILEAELNNLLKMMVEKPVRRFLETIIDEMEKFRGWKVSAV